jgi:hypothetical protein
MELLIVRTRLFAQERRARRRFKKPISSTLNFFIINTLCAAGFYERGEFLRLFANEEAPRVPERGGIQKSSGASCQ